MGHRAFRGGPDLTDAISEIPRVGRDSEVVGRARAVQAAGPRPLPRRGLAEGIRPARVRHRRPTEHRRPRGPNAPYPGGGLHVEESSGESAFAHVRVGDHSALVRHRTERPGQHVAGLFHAKGPQELVACRNPRTHGIERHGLAHVDHGIHRPDPHVNPGRQRRDRHAERVRARATEGQPVGGESAVSFPRPEVGPLTVVHRHQQVQVPIAVKVVQVEGGVIADIEVRANSVDHTIGECSVPVAAVEGDVPAASRTGQNVQVSVLVNVPRRHAVRVAARVAHQVRLRERPVAVRQVEADVPVRVGAPHKILATVLVEIARVHLAPILGVAPRLRRKRAVAVAPVKRQRSSVAAVDQNIEISVAVEIPRRHSGHPVPAVDVGQGLRRPEGPVAVAPEKEGMVQPGGAGRHVAADQVQDAVPVEIADRGPARCPGEIPHLRERSERTVRQHPQCVHATRIVSHCRNPAARQIDQRLRPRGIAQGVHCLHFHVHARPRVEPSEQDREIDRQDVRDQRPVQVQAIFGHANVVVGRIPVHPQPVGIQAEAAVHAVGPCWGVGVGRHVDKERPVVAHGVGQAPRVVKTEVERLSLSRRDGKHGHQVRQVRAPLNDVNPPGTSSPHREGCPLRRRPVGHANRDLAVLPRNRDAHLRTLGPIWLHCQ